MVFFFKKNKVKGNDKTQILSASKIGQDQLFFRSNDERSAIDSRAASHQDIDEVRGMAKQKVSNIKRKETIVAKPTQTSNTGSKEDGVVKDNISISCPCCGTLLRLPGNVPKIRCIVCQVSTYLKNDERSELEVPKEISESGIKRCTLVDLKRIVNECKVKAQQYNLENLGREKLSSEEKSKMFNPVRNYLMECFHSIDILNNSFILKTKNSREKGSMIDFNELNETYDLIMKLPTRKPFYSMICACNDILKRPGIEYSLSDDSVSFRWILIIFFNPMIRECLYFNTSAAKSNQHGNDKNSLSRFATAEINSVAYELAKRCIGYMSSFKSVSKIKFKLFMEYLKNLPLDLLLKSVETVNLYITFQLSRVLNGRKNDHGVTHKKRVINSRYSVGGNLHPVISNPRTNNIPIVSTNVYDGYENANLDDSDMEDDSNIPTPRSDNEAWNPGNLNDELLTKLNGKYIPSQNDFRFRTSDYDTDWHIKNAANLMIILKLANDSRETVKKLKSTSFYNMLLDFIDYKQDFENWRKFKTINRRSTIRTIRDWELLNLNMVKGITFCQYPILLSLGLKISIMNYEVKRIMEFEAEQAFLKSIDQRKQFDVYFKIKVRRTHITSDSLLAIKSHPKDLLKSLRIEFVNEPGIDAGGLRKEWFLLLSKALFNPMNGLFVVNKQCYLSWFNIHPEFVDPNNEEMYYLFGIVLGLAIFNSTILDIQFPKALYKKLCHEPLNFGDYLELYPETGNNLIKLLNYNEPDFENVFALNFETTYDNLASDVIKETSHSKNPSDKITVELCNNGGLKVVTNENKGEFIQYWFDFYMNKSVEKQFRQFQKGFYEVVSQCESSKLFNSEELEKLICGERENESYDFTMLRSICKYTGGYTNYDLVINWFWEIVSSWDFDLQKKFLQFVTGSDRIPSTGISTLSFKISKLTINPYTSLSKSTSDPLPLAHTCFNELCLWEFKSKEALEQKLKVAITESEGYGFK